MNKADANFPEFLCRYQSRIEQALEHCLPPATTYPARLHEAMRYAVLDGGKRIRPLLVYAAGSAVGALDEDLDIPACAVELIHAYSLVHDDLPAMDDDDLRRGKPSCHKAFDEAEATLAGDALQALAFYVLSHAPVTGLGNRERLEMVTILARSAGSRGMVGGQSVDLAAVGKTPDLAELENMHIHKTGALLRASVLMGAACGPDNDPGIHHALDEYGKAIGLAFQVQDDILDVTGDTGTLGKSTGSDLARDKPTYAAILGLQAAREHLTELHQRAHKALQSLGDRAWALREIADLIVSRNR